MKKTVSVSLRQLLSAILLASTLLHPGKAKILDPAAYHPVLREIADALDRHGLDVVQDWRSQITISAPSTVVAPLTEYPILGTLKMVDWIRDFNSGAMGAIMAIKPIGNLKHDTFIEQWYDTPQERRVFISFTKEDAEDAERVRSALEDKGYIAFIYIKHPEDDPAQPPVLVGEYFKTAGHHLVIDTQKARASQGVLAEALMFAQYRRTQSTRGDTVQIYGARKRCPRTREAIQRYTKAGATVEYHDIDADPEAKKVVAENHQWLEDGKYLPFIKINGKPLRFRSEGVKQT
ncbi:MAG TPA: hypothetical protein VGB73_08535, partial [Pyrinomonadaceae bacterium]